MHILCIVIILYLLGFLKFIIDTITKKLNIMQLFYQTKYRSPLPTSDPKTLTNSPTSISSTSPVTSAPPISTNKIKPALPHAQLYVIHILLLICVEHV